MNYTEQVRKQKVHAKALRLTLPKDNHIVSIENRNSVPELEGGKLFAVTNANAAERLSMGTHRLATQDEIDAYYVDQAAKKVAIMAAFEKTQHKTNVVNTIVLSRSDIDQMAKEEPAEQEKPAASSNKKK